VQSLLEGAGQRRAGILAATIGSVAFIVAATGAFLELQAALNTIWRVKSKPGAHLKAFVIDRLRSFGLVVAIGFLLMVSLAVTAALAAFSAWLSRHASGVPLVWSGVQVIVSLVGTTTLFALLYRVLPDVHLGWRDVATGAFVTAVLFTLGQQLIGLYLGQSSMASSYGAAGSVMILLLWVYYSCQILLLGAEFTRVYAEHRGTTVSRARSRNKVDVFRQATRVPDSTSSNQRARTREIPSNLGRRRRIRVPLHLRSPRRMRRDSARAAHCSCELNEERDNQSGDDDEHQRAHSRGRSPITLSTSRLPSPPANVCVGRRKGHSRICHRSASWMLWDMLWRGSLHRRTIRTGGRRATVARTVQSKSEFTFPTIPAIVTATTQSIAMTALIDTRFIVPV
jgi:YihY family inner membrane protein